MLKIEPLRIVFAGGSTLEREKDRSSDLPIHRNGPPGTFVKFGGLRISLPTDLVLRADAIDERVAVTFGGFHFDGLVAGQLVFTRVHDLLPEEKLSPDRSRVMRLHPEWVAVVDVDGTQAWP